MNLFYFPELHFIIKICENFDENLSSGLSRLIKLFRKRFSKNAEIQTLVLS